MCEREFDLNEKHTKWLFGKDGALFRAAVRGERQLVEELINDGADPRAMSGEGFTALHRAAQYGHKDIVELLISKGTDPHSKSTSSDTPLSLAPANGQDEIVRLIRPDKEEP